MIIKLVGFGCMEGFIKAPKGVGPVLYLPLPTTAKHYSFNQALDNKPTKAIFYCQGMAHDERGEYFIYEFGDIA